MKDIERQNRNFENKLQDQNRKIQAQIINEKKQRREELKKTRKQLEYQITSAVGAERAARERDISRINSQISTLDKDLRREIKNVDVHIRKDMLRQREYLVERMDSLVGEERSMREQEIRRVDTNIQQLDNAIAQVDQKLDAEITRVENNFKEMLNIEAEQRKLEINNLQQWTAKNFEEQRKEYLEIAKQHEQEIQSNRNAIKEIYKKIEVNEESARAYIKDFQTLIENSYEKRKPDFDKYVPGDINRIIRISNQAAEQLNEGSEQAAKAVAVNGYDKWLDLNEELEKKKREFDFWHGETLKEVLLI
ncbi:MAG: hypothetical protein R2788_19195 [Saprospiraceae bacterium]